MVRTYRVPEPSRFAQMTFVEALRDAGVSATADLKLEPPGPRLQSFYTPENQVAEHVSPAEEAKVTLARSDLLNHALMITGKGMAGYIDRKDGRRLVFAAYMGMVNGDPETISHRVGNVLGEIAAAAYGAPLAP